MNVLRILLLFIVISSISGCNHDSDDEEAVCVLEQCCEDIIQLDFSCCVSLAGADYRSTSCICEYTEAFCCAEFIQFDDSCCVAGIGADYRTACGY